MPSIVCLAFTPCKWFFKSVILIIHLLPLMLAFLFIIMHLRLFLRFLLLSSILLYDYITTSYPAVDSHLCTYCALSL